MWQVEAEIHNPAAGRCQVGLVEKDAEEEALHDGSCSEGQQEEEEDDGVAVVQDSSTLQDKDRETQVMAWKLNDIGEWEAWLSLL